MAIDKDRLYKKLDHVGEHAVRENLAKGVYGENRRGFVEEWLEQFQDYGEAAAIGEEALEPVNEGGELSGEEDRVALPKITSEQWYQRPLGVLVLVVLIVGFLIYFFEWY